MAHRFNIHEDRKTPKPSSNERTWSRYRFNHNIENTQDKMRREEHEAVKSKIKEDVIQKMKVTQQQAMELISPLISLLKGVNESK